MFGIDEGKIPRYKASDAGIRKARWLFYVDLTRAKSEVHIMYAGFTVNWGVDSQGGAAGS